jgi:hypothetical protein
MTTITTSSHSLTQKSTSWGLYSFPVSNGRTWAKEAIKSEAPSKNRSNISMIPWRSAKRHWNPTVCKVDYFLAYSYCTRRTTQKKTAENNGSYVQSPSDLITTRNTYPIPSCWSKNSWLSQMRWRHSALQIRWRVCSTSFSWTRFLSVIVLRHDNAVGFINKTDDDYSLETMLAAIMTTNLRPAKNCIPLILLSCARLKQIIPRSTEVITIDKHSSFHSHPSRIISFLHNTFEQEARLHTVGEWQSPRNTWYINQ